MPRYGQTHPSTRFWKFVEKMPGRNGCWEWIGARQPDGAGVIHDRGKAKRAYRVSWEMHKGPIPDDIGVCHHCDNRPCVRPDHLFLGDQLANMQDASRKGRTNGAIDPSCGEAHYKVILTIEQVRAVLTSEESNAEAGRRLGVHRSTIYRIRAGKNWVRTLATEEAAHA